MEPKAAFVCVVLTGGFSFSFQAYFKKRNIGGLLAGRDRRLVGKSKQVEGVDGFELITWLVIKGKTVLYTEAGINVSWLQIVVN